METIISLECLWSGVIGSLITIIASFMLCLTKEFLEAKACNNAIKSEIKNLKTIFETTFDSKITNDNVPLWYTYPLSTDYFTIFNNNSSSLGKISNKKERELIIAIYTIAKYFLDCLRTNNECIEYYEYIENEKYTEAEKNIPLIAYKRDIEIAEERLIHSKTENILPTYIKLKELFKQIKF